MFRKKIILKSNGKSVITKKTKNLDTGDKLQLTIAFLRLMRQLDLNDKDLNFCLDFSKNLEEEGVDFYEKQGFFNVFSKK